MLATCSRFRFNVSPTADWTVFVAAQFARLAHSLTGKFLISDLRLQLLQEGLEAGGVGYSAERLELSHVGDFIFEECLEQDGVLEHIVEDQASDEVVIEINRLVQDSLLLDEFLAQVGLIFNKVVELLGLAL